MIVGVGTRKDNTEDMMKKGRHHTNKTIYPAKCGCGIEIQSAYKGHRLCPSCYLEYRKSWNNKNKDKTYLHSLKYLKKKIEKCVRTCPVCLKPFTPDHPARAYCGRACWWNERKRQFKKWKNKKKGDQKNENYSPPQNR